MVAFLLYFQGSYINHITQEVVIFLDKYKEEASPNFTYEQMVTEHRTFSPYVTGKLDILMKVVYFQATLVIILLVLFFISHRRKAQQ